MNRHGKKKKNPFMFIGLNGVVVLMWTVVSLMLCWVSEDGGENGGGGECEKKSSVQSL